MKSFFVQSDKQQAKGSAIMFIFSEVYGALELGINGLDRLIAFFGAIAFANVILLSYQLVENNNVPKSWETGTAMIAAVALGFGIFDTAYIGTDASINTDGIYLFILITIIGFNVVAEGVVSNIWRYMAITGSLGLFFFIGFDYFFDNLFFDNLPEWTFPIGLIFYISWLLGIGVGTYTAWNKREE